MRKTIMIDGKAVEFKASAAVPRMYRIKFGKDLFIDLQKLANSVEKNGATDGKEESEIPIDDLSAFENIAYIMAKHASPQDVPSNIEEWLEGFDTFSIYQVLPEIMELWKLGEATSSTAKKK